MGENKKDEKLSYEELSNVAGQLQQQNKFLIEQLKKTQEEGFYKRLDYLYKTVELNEFFPEDFVFNCVNEIIGTMTIPEEVKQQETQEIK